MFSLIIERVLPIPYISVYFTAIRNINNTSDQNPSVDVVSNNILIKINPAASSGALKYHNFKEFDRFYEEHRGVVFYLQGDCTRTHGRFRVGTVTKVKTEFSKICIIPSSQCLLSIFNIILS